MTVFIIEAEAKTKSIKLQKFKDTFEDLKICKKISQLIKSSSINNDLDKCPIYNCYKYF